MYKKRIWKILAIIMSACMFMGSSVFANEFTADIETEETPNNSILNDTEYSERELLVCEETNQTEDKNIDICEEMEVLQGLYNFDEDEENIEMTYAPQTSYTPVQKFVIRLYNNILNRDADQEGFNAWTQKLVTKQNTGAQVAEGFIYSRELAERKLSDSAYVDMLYATFLDRSADSAGKKDWVYQLENGVSRALVFKGFVESREFSDICAKYGIERGSVVLTEAKDKNAGVTMFVYRCYKKFLDREPDHTGLNNWCNQMITGNITAKDAAEGFVMSNEFQKKNISNIDYVQILYQGLFDRNADNTGLNDWVNKLDMGYSKKNVFYGFADSQEFRALAQKFGLNSTWATTQVSLSETYLKNLFKKKTGKNYTYFIYDSFDYDSRNEAFVIVCNKKPGDNNDYFETDVDMWFINADGKITSLFKGGYGNFGGVIDTGNRKFVCWDRTVGTIGSTITEIYSCKNGSAYSPKISGQVKTLTKVENKYYSWMNDYSHMTGWFEYEIYYDDKTQEFYF